MNPRQTGSQLGYASIAGVVTGLSVCPSCTGRHEVDQLDFADFKNGDEEPADNLLFESWEEALRRHSGAAACTVDADKERDAPRGCLAAQIPTSSSSLLYG